MKRIFVYVCNMNVLLIMRKLIKLHNTSNSIFRWKADDKYDCKNVLDQPHDQLIKLNFHFVFHK